MASISEKSNEELDKEEGNHIYTQAKYDITKRSVLQA